MLAASSLHVAGSRRPRLAGISLEVQAGEVLALVGPNGSGKTTLLACLSGEIRAERGEVELAGRPIAAWPAAERARRLAVLPQRSHLVFPFRVHEVVALGRMPHAPRSLGGRDLAAVESALRRCDAWHLRERSYTTLSGGEQHRVQLARVLAQLDVSAGPAALLLDEPLADLDPAQQHAVLQLVQEVASTGVAIVLSVHDLGHAARHARRVAVLSEGHLVAWGCPALALDADCVRRVFRVDSTRVPHPRGGQQLLVTGPMHASGQPLHAAGQP